MTRGKSVDQNRFSMMANYDPELCRRITETGRQISRYLAERMEGIILYPDTDSIAWKNTPGGETHDELLKRYLRCGQMEKVAIIRDLLDRTRYIHLEKDEIQKDYIHFILYDAVPPAWVILDSEGESTPPDWTAKHFLFGLGDPGDAECLVIALLNRKTDIPIGSFPHDPKLSPGQHCRKGPGNL